MRRRFNISPCFLFLLSISPIIFIRPADAAVPSTFTYQGSLKQNGTPVSGDYSMEFRITSSTGALYWTSGVKTVPVIEGLYRVDLAPTGVNWRFVDAHIEVKLGGTTLLPRERLTSAPFALVAKELEGGIPGMTGEIRLWPTNSAPAGWHICNGTALSRENYTDLFAVIGTTFGSGDGSTTFNLPDFRRRVPVGAGGGGTGTLGSTVGSVGGAETHTHPMPHKHQTTLAQQDGTGSQIQLHGSFGLGNDATSGQGGSAFSATGIIGTDWNYELTDNPTVSDTSSGSTIQPSIVVNFIIKD